MKRAIVGTLVGTALLVLSATAVAEQLALNSLLAAGSSDAASDDVAAVARDSKPDDARLVDLVRLIESGISETIIAEQVRQSGETYNLSVDDLLYLERNGAQESTIAALMATSAGATTVAPSELVFDGLVLVNSGPWSKDRKGRLVLRGDTLDWEDRRKVKQNFTFQIAGLEKVWFTCEARSAEDFCYQINFKIVKGDRYRFRDVQRASGSNAAVTDVMEALRTYHPRLGFGPPDA